MKKILLRGYYMYLDMKKRISILYNWAYSLVVEPPIIHNTDETINKMVATKCSVSRYGDGEFSLMNGKGLLFQPYSHELSKRLKEVINSEVKNHIVCIPYAIKSTEWCTDIAKKYWREYFGINRSKVYKTINFNKKYFDAQVTRLYIDHKDKRNVAIRFRQLKELWDDREVIIIEGVKSRLGLGNNLFDNVRSLNRIICPAVDAFGKYNEILTEASKQNPNKLFLIALGPTATVLAYDLSNLGYQAIDIGHIDIEYEWFLSKAVEKVPVTNKYIGEMVGGTNVSEELIDVVYGKEIISKIG
ncbi:SP_1767 family glycosyltransferase [Peribacillus sp. NPDC097197]|uniref:SP_1767 family glycosyltransferase n=1 Tax=Peribacillus sp. NPDC097197 TaxID=3390615 RepID=UPI003D04BBA3